MHGALEIDQIHQFAYQSSIELLLEPRWMLKKKKKLRDRRWGSIRAFAYGRRMVTSVLVNQSVINFDVPTNVLIISCGLIINKYPYIHCMFKDTKWLNKRIMLNITAQLLITEVPGNAWSFASIGPRRLKYYCVTCIKCHLIFGAINSQNVIVHYSSRCNKFIYM